MLHVLYSLNSKRPDMLHVRDVRADGRTDPAVARVHEGAALCRQGPTRANVLWPQRGGLGARESAAMRQGRVPAGGILQLARLNSHILLRPQVSPSLVLALAVWYLALLTRQRVFQRGPFSVLLGRPGIASHGYHALQLYIILSFKTEFLFR